MTPYMTFFGLFSLPLPWAGPRLLPFMEASQPPDVRLVTIESLGS